MDSNERSKVEATIGSMPRQGRQGWQGRYLLPPLPPLPPLVLIFAVLPRPPIGAHGLSPTARRVVQRCGADRRLAGGRGAGPAARRAGAAAADAAGSVLAAGPAGARVRRDRGGARHERRSRAGALPSRRTKIEGALGVNEHELLDGKLQELARQLGA